MASQPMPYRLERSVLIQAARDVVFSYFTDTTRWARWWGTGSTIDPRTGGAVLIVHPGGVQVAGEILEIDPPARLVFTYGYVSGTPMPVGASVVTLQLEDDRQGTRLNLSHVFADEKVRDEMVQGWRYQFALFGNLVADDTNTGASTAVDAWFAAWSEPDAARREAMLDRLATEEVRFKDRFSLIDGLSDLRPHLAAVHRFMPGCGSNAKATCGTARARCSPTGWRAPPMVRSAAAAPTCSPSATTAASRRSPVSGDHRRRRASSFEPAFLRGRVHDTATSDAFPRLSTRHDAGNPRGYNEPRDRQRTASSPVFRREAHLRRLRPLSRRRKAPRTHRRGALRDAVTQPEAPGDFPKHGRLDLVVSPPAPGWASLYGTTGRGVQPLRCRRTRSPVRRRVETGGSDRGERSGFARPGRGNRLAEHATPRRETQAPVVRTVRRLRVLGRRSRHRRGTRLPALRRHELRFASHGSLASHRARARCSTAGARSSMPGTSRARRRRRCLVRRMQRDLHHGR